jgi:hypothetical protein
MVIEVERSDLEKVHDVLSVALRHHRARDESNAALHLAAQARYSPLTSQLESEYERLTHVLTG